MFWDISQNPANFQQDRDAATEPGVINAFNPVQADTAVDSLYNNNGSVGALGAFARMGVWPVTPGDPFTVNLTAGPRNWLFNAARINFHTALPVSSGNLVSSVTAGVTMSSDLSVISVLGANVPGGAVYAVTNIKYAINGSYASTNVIPTGSLDALLPLVMVNYGTEAVCLTDYGDGTEVENDDLPDLDGRLCLAQNGQKLFFRTAYSVTHDLVHRVALEEQNYDYNSDFQFLSYVQIPVSTPASKTPGGFVANYTGTPSDPDTLYIESDNSPAYRMGGANTGASGFLGGNHGIGGYTVTATAHGKTITDVGRTYTKQSKTWTLARIIDANRMVFAPEVTGGAEDWVLDQTVLTSGTMVSTDASGDITITGTPAAQQLYPSLQGVERTILVEGGRFTETSGVYDARRVRIHVDYRIPNVRSVYEFMWDHVGSSDPIFYNDLSIDAQVGVHLEYVFDAYGVTAVRHEVTALQDHYRGFMWPSQHQALTYISASSETLWFLNPNSVSFQSGIDQNGGTAKDFSQWVNVTSNALEYYARNTTWKPAAFWSDNVQRPARVFAFEVRSSGGTALKRYVMANSAIQGRTAENDYSVISHFLSNAEKSYMVSGYNENVLEGEATATVGAWGFMDLTLDVEADISFAFPLFGGGYEWVWSTLNGALTDYEIPLPPQLVGRQLEVVNRSASVTVTIDGDTATVTTTDDAYITFRAR